MRFGSALFQGNFIDALVIKLKRSLNMAKLSWLVFLKDREMLVISIATVVPIFGVLITYSGIVGPFFDSPTSSNLNNEVTVNGGFVVFMLSIPFVVLILISIAEFGQGALIAAAYDRMTGGDPTIRSALQSAFRFFVPLTGWILIKFAIAMIIFLLKLLENNEDGRRRSGSRLLRIGQRIWKFASSLTVAAIVLDRKGPIKALKHSVSLLRKTWGENLTGKIGFGLLRWLCVLPSFVLLEVGGFPVSELLRSIGDEEGYELDLLYWTNPETIMTRLGILLSVLWIIAAIVFVNTLSTIYKTAVYVYATRGDSVIVGFEEVDFQEVFTVKTG